MTDHYRRIEELDTDSFWVLATLCLRTAARPWQADKVVAVLQGVGYCLENGLDHTRASVLKIGEDLRADDWLKQSSAKLSVSLPVARAVRRYLLIHFPEEAAQLVAYLTLPSPTRGRLPRRSPGRGRTGTLTHSEREWLPVFRAEKDVVGPLLEKLTVCFSEGLEPAYPETGRTGVFGSAELVDACAAFLPPYPEGFLDEAPPAVRRGIARAFAVNPLLFPADSHGELWTVVGSFAGRDDQLVVRAAMNFLPAPPPGAGPELWGRYPDLAVVAGWAGGEKSPDEDTVPFDVNQPNAAWMLRALLRHGRGKMTTSALRKGFAQLRYLPASTLDYLLAPDRKKQPRVFSEADFVPFTVALNGLALRWSGGEFSLSFTEAIALNLHLMTLRGMPWLNGQISAVCAHALESDSMRDNLADYAASFAAVHGLHYFGDLLQPPEKWEDFLRQLEDKVGGAAGAKDVDEAKRGDVRIVYVYEPLSNNLQAKEQTFGKNGWTRGRQLSWDRFARRTEEERDEVLTPAFRNYAGQPLTFGRANYWENQVHDINTGQALYLLAGHPLVYEGDAARLPLAITAAEPQLLVEHDEDDNLSVRLEPHGLKAGYNPQRTAPRQNDGLLPRR